MDTPDPLNDQLADLADAIAVDDPQMSLSSVRATAARRSRRRNILGGAVAVAALAGGVLVVANVTDNGGPDSIAIEGAQAETRTTDEESEPDVGATGEAPDGTTVVPGSPAEEPPSITTRVETITATPRSISIGAGSETAETEVEWVVPWQDGFLASRYNFTPQPLPGELPEEVTALFSPEVLDLFADGLPPTIEEATAMLSEAGLLDEVTAVLADNPEANEAVFSGGSPQGPDADVVFSANGVDWEPIDFTTPDGTFGLYGVQSTGTRLAVATQVFSEPSEGADWGRGGEVGEIIVATTTDLVNWDITTVDVAERPAELPDVFFYSVSPGELAMTDDGWVLPVTAYSDIEVETLLPDDVRDRVQRSSGGFSTGWDDAGVTIEIMDGAPVDTVPSESSEDGEFREPPVSETLTITWAELGVDPQDLEAMDGQPDSQVFASTWGAAPMPVDGVNAWSITAGGDGFYSANGVSLSYSPDGIAWVSLDAPIEDLAINMVKPVPGGALAFADDIDGATQVLRVSGSANNWELLEIPGVPTAFHDALGNGTSASAMIAQGSEPQEIEPTEITVESDGNTMVMREEGRQMTVTVTDADGNVIADETHRWRPNDEPTTWRYGRLGLEILDPESGDVIVTFDNAAMEAAYREQTDRYDNIEKFDEFGSDLWLIATLTGDRWLVEDLDTVTDFGRVQPGLAVNGSTLIVNHGDGDGWQLYDLS